MKSLCTLLVLLLTGVSMGATTVYDPVFVDVSRNGTEKEGMNLYDSDNADVLNLKDYQGNDTSYTLKIVKSKGVFGNAPVSTVTPGVDDPSYYTYFQNKAAMDDLLGEMGSFDFTSLAQYVAPGAGGSTTSSIQLGGLTAGQTVTFYMFVSSMVTPPGATTVTGGTGIFEYGATNGTGFSSTPSFTNSKLTLVKWTGTATDSTLDFKIGGAKAGVAAIAFKVIPEPATASLGLMGLAALMLRRRRALI